MPARLKRTCRHRGCPSKTADNSGYCDKHRKTDYGWIKWQRKKGNVTQRGYGADWRKLRDLILVRDNYLCQECMKSGIAKEGCHVDHIVPKFKGGTDDPDNLQTLCSPCHARKTASEVEGGRSNLH